LLAGLHTYIARKKSNSFALGFAAYLMQIRNVRLQIMTFATGISVLGISKGTLSKVNIIYPPKPEQQKIASFLTAVDNKIQQLQKKKQLLEQYKKGVMQQIFTQQLRFKDDEGMEYPEWEEKELEEIAVIIMGQSPDSNTYNVDRIGKCLIQGNADISYRKTNPKIWTSAPTKECVIGDIIMTVRAPVGYIAMSIHDACIGRGVCAIRPKKNNSTDFLYQFLLFSEKDWRRLEQGSTFTAVNSKDIKTLLLPMPCIKEQTKIAALLSGIDSKINLVETDIEQTQNFKKGLLQQMFV
jgi:type I restriction enzyme S subunit